MSSGLCNCGRQLRYHSSRGLSCNKYSVCPTYSELEDRVKEINAAFNQLKEANDALKFELGQNVLELSQAKAEIARLREVLEQTKKAMDSGNDWAGYELLCRTLAGDNDA